MPEGRISSDSRRKNILLVRTLDVFALCSSALVRIFALVSVCAKRARRVQLESPRTDTLETAVGIFTGPRGRTQTLQKRQKYCEKKSWGCFLLASHRLLRTLVRVQAAIAQLAEPYKKWSCQRHCSEITGSEAQTLLLTWGTDTLKGAESVDALKLAVMFPGGALVLKRKKSESKIGRANALSPWDTLSLQRRPSGPRTYPVGQELQ